MLGAILIIILILLVIGLIPRWGYSSGWGYYPSSGLVLILLMHPGQAGGAWNGSLSPSKNFPNHKPAVSLPSLYRAEHARGFQPFTSACFLKFELVTNGSCR
jgi:hypothetical protein